MSEKTLIPLDRLNELEMIEARVLKLANHPLYKNFVHADMEYKLDAKDAANAQLRERVERLEEGLRQASSIIYGETFIESGSEVIASEAVSWISILLQQKAVQG